MAKNKNIIKLLCPVCGMEHHINKQTEVKCLCFSKLIVVKNGKTKELIQEGEENIYKKKDALIRCRDCRSCFSKSETVGDCLDTDNMRRNINPNCLSICKRFKPI